MIRWLSTAIPLLAVGCGGGEYAMARFEKNAPVEHEAPVPAVLAAIAVDRDIVYTGWLSLHVPDPDASERALEALAKELGGWLHRLERPRATLRIPSTRFTEAMTRSAALGDVIDRRISAADVTDSHRDIRARLDNAEKVRQRLTAILAQANIIPDALAVERELARVTEEIEKLKGALAVLQDQISFATVTVELRRSTAQPARITRFPFLWLRFLGVDSVLHLERDP